MVLPRRPPPMARPLPIAPSHSFASTIAPANRAPAELRKSEDPITRPWGGAISNAELAAEGTRDVEWVIALARRFLDAGVPMLMIESEGITENVTPWRTDVIAKLAAALGTERLMFEAADPDAFNWYIKMF